MALSIRLRSRMAMSPAWPAASTAAPSARSISTFFDQAYGASSATAVLARARRSQACAVLPGSCGSRRASVNSCCTRWVARSQPAITWSSARVRSASLADARATCAWVFNAASGVRSSCEASAVKRRSFSISCATRSNSRFRFSISGSTSVGTLPASRLPRLPGSRSATCRPSAASGRSPRATLNQTSPPSKGRANSNGSSRFFARLAAISSRVS